jgi:ribosome-binding factor A
MSQLHKSDQSSRQLKVAQIIMQELSSILSRGKKLDLRLMENKITITRVMISADLRNANCYFLPQAGTKISAGDFLESFEASKFAIRKQLTESINLKYSPELRFFYDKASENAMHVNSILAKVVKTDLENE